MLRKPVILTAVVLMALTASAAQAQQRTPSAQAQRAPSGGPQICAPRAALVEKLKAEFGEEPEAIGVTHSGGLFEILSSSTGTWTVLATGPNGVACLVLSGDGWMSKDRAANTTKAHDAKKLDM